MSYQVGDMVVYPRHGAAKVEAITERTVKGVTREYLQLSVLSSDGLVINVPVENAKKVGVRDIVSGSEVAKVFEILRTPIIEKEMNWSRRYKLNVEKIATGDVALSEKIDETEAQRLLDVNLGYAPAQVGDDQHHAAEPEEAAADTLARVEAEKKSKKK